MRGRLAGRRRVGRDDALAHLAVLDAAVELGHLEVLGVDAVDRRQRAAEHVVAAGELVRALDRDDVARLLDDADDRAVAALVLTDPALRPVGEVEAHLAQPDALLDLADRVGERVGVFGRLAQDVEGEPLRGARADAGQFAQLRDEPLDRGGVGAQRPGSPRPPSGPPGPPPSSPVTAPILLAASCCAWSTAWLTAAVIMSCSISTSSGSTASGSILISLTTRSPDTLTVTMPPPADAVTSSSLSCSCAAIMSCCIFWTCLSICCMFGWGIRSLPSRRRRSPPRRTPS